jgi:hypothetical protein
MVMKHEKPFYALCFVVYSITLGLFMVLLLAALNVLHLSTGLVIAVIPAVLIMAFLSFACGCILQTLCDDKRSRTVNRNARWKR